METSYSNHLIKVYSLVSNHHSFASLNTKHIMIWAAILRWSNTYFWIEQSINVARMQMRQSAFLVFFRSISWPTNTWNCFQGLLSQTQQKKCVFSFFFKHSLVIRKKVLRLSLENAYCSIVISVFTLNFEKAIICVFLLMSNLTSTFLKEEFTIKKW